MTILTDQMKDPRAAEAAESIDLAAVDEAIARYGTGVNATIPLLQAVQEHYGWLPQPALDRICEKTEITPARLTGVSTFYSQFRHTPVGQHRVKVCHGTACHVKGAPRITDAIRDYLGIEGADDTDSDGVFTVEKIACLGCCTLAPAVQIDEITYGYLTPDKVGAMLKDFLEVQKKGKGKEKPEPLPAGEFQGEVLVGLGSCCIARGSGNVNEAVKNTLAEIGANVRVKRVGCVGMCHQTPLLEITRPAKPSVLYAEVNPEDARDIILRHFRPQGFLRRTASKISTALDRLLTDEAWDGVEQYAITPREPEVEAFLGRQRHLATEKCGQIDPLDLDEYILGEGFGAFRKAREEMTPEEIIEQIKASGLRGRGGAGFPTGVKWSYVRAAAGEKKYVVCNCDEGDPGAFMDRMLLESYPFRILEGMCIAAHAVGADEGYFYIRAEYPLAVSRMNDAIDQARERGLLGEGFSVHIMEGAGAFVCGEETALLASIEGERGMPRYRPPYPAERGLWGKPTLVNNTETLSLVPWILRHGPEAFAEMGTERSKGTKVFALAGKIARGGLIEVPMGVTIRQIVDEIGGGVPGGKKLKAVQVGGPSGGCVPADLADTPVDYEALTSRGAIMGSGGLVVLDETDCMVEIARYFLEFTQDQSCGKCTFCRVGTRHMLGILERLCNGEGKKGDVELIEELAHQIVAGSLCQLGGTAPNPVLSTLKYFRDEYEAHVEGRCPAGKCKPLISFHVTDDCIGCTLCAQACPVEAIAAKPYEVHEIDQEACIRCGGCQEVCPVDAVRVE
jgi:NADH-quinone oxidoreductase subunit F